MFANDHTTVKLSGSGGVRGVGCVCGGGGVDFTPILRRETTSGTSCLVF